MFQNHFKALLTQGMVCHETYQDKGGNWLYPEQVQRTKEGYITKDSGDKVVAGPSIKMSKSKYNTVDPDAIVEKYGADTARLFMLSDSPPERDLEWSEMGVEGCYKYLNRLWRLSEGFDTSKNQKIENVEGELLEVRKLTHKTIHNVTKDLEGFHFNKAVARIRELTNALEKMKKESDVEKAVFSEGFQAVLKLFNPFIPHITEELWGNIGNKESLINTKWPVAEKELLVDDTVTIAIQVNGKLRATIEMPKDSSKEEIEKLAFNDPKVNTQTEGKQIKKVVYVPNKILNVVVA